MDSAQWTQEFGVAKSMAAEVGGPPSACTRPLMEKKLARPQKDQVINCPRCQSANTKFCYYNNYSLTQPRYFCKTCRRYWTEGGTLRNVPVGGGSRKNKIIKSTSSNITSSHKLIPDLNPPQFSSENPKILHDHHQGQDLNLGFHGLNLPHDHHYHHHFLDINSSSCANSSSSNTALNFLRNGIGLNNSFNIPMATNGLENNALFASGNFHQFQECKPTSLAFSINGNHDQYGNNNNNNSNDHHHQSQENNTINGSLMFTLGSAKEQSSTSDHHKEHGNGNGFWNGMLGGGGSW